MTVMLLGDSLSAGKLGVGYSGYLNLPSGYRIVNRGRNGDTVQGIRGRLDSAVGRTPPEIVVLQVGANDILLPEMAGRDPRWRVFVDEMIARGHVPSPDSHVFSREYRELVGELAHRGVLSIVCVTIPPIGEDLDTGRNRRRAGFNDHIRRIASGQGVLLADVAREFERYLADERVISREFFDRPEDFTRDVREMRRIGADELSRIRGFHLTTDGAHLNDRGARIAGGVIGRTIQSSR